MPTNPEVAGQSPNIHGQRFVLLGEMLDDVLDVDGWELVADNTPTLAPEQEAERRARENPPKRAG